MYHIYIETMSSYVRCLVSTGNHRIEIHTLNVMIHNGGKLKKTYYRHSSIYTVTGKSLSEALIFASTNPQYVNRLFIELQVQYMKIPSLNLGRTCCVLKLFLTFRTIVVHNMFSPSSAKRRASDKDLPVSST